MYGQQNIKKKKTGISAALVTNYEQPATYETTKSRFQEPLPQELH